MKKILFLLTGLDYAGAENQVVQLCRALRARNYTVHLISMVRPSAYIDELEEMDVNIQTLHMRKGIADPRAIFRLKRMIVDYRPDVIHSHMVHANLLARLTRVFVHIPLLICTAHSINEGGVLRNLLYRMTDPFCDLTTNVSQEAVNRYIEIKAAPEHKIVYMPNGINMERFIRSEEDGQSIREELQLGEGFIWTAAGRLAPEKDYETMLKAFAQVLLKFPDSKLLIAGIGPLRGALEELCHILEIAPSVRFLGIRSDISRLMSVADAYVLSSKWEGLPMVLLEASASSLPIVATDVGGNREVVREGINGYLAPAGHPESLAVCMLRMMAHSSSTLAEMGRAGREYVSRTYNINTIVERWERIYEQEDIRPLSS
ncbi:glycosyltransferase involved in cell wall biosynthesis [Paenibacillus shirakamiensis]|uniref:Glycosyltransferase involved in cell wall biosynthesis n=1 Tax=Paenibacillus shirakamiensis TaxID=1265935 RepID=A0ABS4JLI2_9BACL|nr:glycosyltransferase involved in cell wall biosynthesis [Paenibacillus shirakamiensis]